MDPITLDKTSTTDFKEEVKNMSVDMKADLMSQVDGVVKDQVSSILKEMKS